jgi:hypothetical protein
MGGHIFYTELPEDVLEAVRLLLLYFKQDRDSPTPRPLYPKAVKRAARLLDLSTDWDVPPGKPRRWRLRQEEHWRKRLELAGLNPDNPMEIVDQDRWNIAWQQLVKTDSFKADQQQRSLALGEKAPPAEGILSVVSASLRKKPAARTQDPPANPAADMARAYLARKIKSR